MTWLSYDLTELWLDWLSYDLTELWLDWAIELRSHSYIGSFSTKLPLIITTYFIFYIRDSILHMYHISYVIQHITVFVVWYMILYMKYVWNTIYDIYDIISKNYMLFVVCVIYYVLLTMYDISSILYHISFAICHLHYVICNILLTRIYYLQFLWSVFSKSRKPFCTIGNSGPAPVRFFPGPFRMPKPVYCILSYSCIF